MSILEWVFPVSPLFLPKINMPNILEGLSIVAHCVRLSFMTSASNSRVLVPVLGPSLPVQYPGNTSQKALENGPWTCDTDVPLGDLDRICGSPLQLDLNPAVVTI